MDALKIVVIGYGSIGRRYVDNLLTRSGLEIIVCTNKKNTDLEKKGCKIHHSIENSLHEIPDVAIITNVTSLHAKTALKLANAKCDLFIEKPLSHSMHDIQHLMDLTKKKRLITIVGCNMRFHPCLRKIKEIIDKGEIGRVISVRAENGSYLPDWHPYEDYRQSYASRDDLGGGVVLTCIHEIDYLYWFFGDVKEVFSITGKFSDLKLSSEDLSSILLRFQSGIVAEVHLDYFQMPNSRSCKIIGTKGTIYWDSDSNIVKVYYGKKKEWSEVLHLKKYDSNDMYLKEMNHFLDCVEKRKQTINSLHDGAKVLKIALAVKKSSKTRRMIKL